MKELKIELRDNNLINELLDYGLNVKAYQVYIKCLKAGKHVLASKIRIKYRLEIIRHDDMVMAVTMAIMAIDYAKTSKSSKSEQ